METCRKVGGFSVQKTDLAVFPALHLISLWLQKPLMWYLMPENCWKPAVQWWVSGGSSAPSTLTDHLVCHSYYFFFHSKRIDLVYMAEFLRNRFDMILGPF